MDEMKSLNEYIKESLLDDKTQTDVDNELTTGRVIAFLNKYRKRRDINSFKKDLKQLFDDYRLDDKSTHRWEKGKKVIGLSNAGATLYVAHPSKEQLIYVLDSGRFDWINDDDGINEYVGEFNWEIRELYTSTEKNEWFFDVLIEWCEKNIMK